MNENELENYKIWISNSLSTYTISNKYYMQARYKPFVGIGVYVFRGRLANGWDGWEQKLEVKSDITQMNLGGCIKWIHINWRYVEALSYERDSSLSIQGLVVDFCSLTKWRESPMVIQLCNWTGHASQWKYKHFTGNINRIMFWLHI